MSILENGVPQEDHERAVNTARQEGQTAGHAAGHAAGLKEGEAKGAQTAYGRISTILASDKVRGRETYAVDLACKSPDMSADQVIDFVSKIPVAQARPPLSERAAETGAADLAPGTTAPGPGGNPGTTEEQRQRAAQEKQGWADAAKDTNASRGRAAPAAA